ncbi:MAG: SCP2 sterol-binding domain-containing protein [Acidimicrobiales bacterium]
MAAFLSAEWLAALNDTLGAAGPAPLEHPESGYRLVFEFTDGPSALAHALTFSVTANGASAELGDHLGADAVIRLSFRDAEALTSGTLESASALREGRLKVRGDIHGLVPLLDWLQASK